MNAKKLIVGSIVGTIVYYFLGFLVYGLLFMNLYPQTGTENMLFIFLGCMFFGILIAYVIAGKLDLKTAMSGASVGAVIGGLYAASSNFFMYSSMEADYGKIITDIAISIVLGAIVGAFVSYVNGKLN